MSQSFLATTMIAAKRSFVQFRTNFLRTALTLLGVVMGVGAVVAMMSIGEGAQREIIAQIESMGAKSVHIIGKQVASIELANLVNKSTGLTPADADAIGQSLSDVESVGYRASFTPSYTDLRRLPHETVVFGASLKLMETQNIGLGSGRAFHFLDHRNGTRVAIVGEAFANDEFGGNAIGKMVRIDESIFTIVGVLKPNESSNASFSASYDEAVFVPLETLFDELKPAPAYGVLDMISVQVKTTEATLSAKSVISNLLKQKHGGVKDFDIISPEEVLRQKKKTQSLFNAVLIAIAAISLIVGGIGVMNIMLANVMERISEIGLRRAIGARKKDIRAQFLAESVLICFTGGFIGVLLGFGGSYLASVVSDLRMAFAWEATLLAFFISFIVGVTFGLMPAMKAADVDPIEALRS